MDIKLTYVVMRCCIFLLVLEDEFGEDQTTVESSDKHQLTDHMNVVISRNSEEPAITASAF